MKGKDENRNFIPFVSGTFGEVGAKYKNKYRSLTYNIKDPKNDGLFRRILLRDLSPIEVRRPIVFYVPYHWVYLSPSPIQYYFNKSNVFRKGWGMKRERGMRREEG